MKKSLDLAVCIPVNDPVGNNRSYFFHLLESLSNQSILAQEVVVSSNHLVPYVEEVVKKYPELNLKFFVSVTNGASQNFNNAVAASNSKYVHFICQDDFLVDSNSLVLNYNSAVNSKSGWSVSGCIRFDTKAQRFLHSMTPRYNWRLINGVNSIGAPSVSAFRRDSFVPLNDKLHFMYDCEWYVHMAHVNGKPAIQKKATIGIRLHEFQSTHSVEHLLDCEIELSSKLHKESLFIRNCYCVQEF